MDYSGKMGIEYGIGAQDHISNGELKNIFRFLQWALE